MHIRGTYIVVVAVFIMLATITGGSAILHHDWQTGHTSLFVINPKIDWVRYWINVSIRRSKVFLFANKEIGLPQVRLYVPEKSQQRLMDALPASVKKWQQAYLIYPDGKMRRVQARYRGDNPFNWMFGKKSWRIKTRKRRLIDRVRVFNYSIPQTESMLSEFLANETARDTGLLAAKERMVELFINDQSKGAHIEHEHLDESFLRNNNLMPINMYKGEQIHSERAFMTDHDLFNNPSLWKKLSINNHLPKADYSDLAYALNLIRQAENSAAAFEELKRLVPFEHWARFSAYQVLVQSTHNDEIHNMRLAFDNWRGQLLPVAHDTGFNPDLLNGFFLEEPTGHTLLRLLQRSSQFNLVKYNFLYQYVINDRLLETFIKRIKTLGPGLDLAHQRDAYLAQTVYHAGEAIEFASLEGFRTMRREFLDQAVALGEWLKDQLQATPKAVWRRRNGNLILSVDGPLPINEVTMKFMDEAAIPSTIYWDANADGRINKGDFELPVNRRGLTATIEATWFANRIANVNPTVLRATDFILISEKELRPREIAARSLLTAEIFELNRQDNVAGALPSRWNVPLIATPIPTEQVWSGRIAIHEDTIVRAPLRILAGTQLEMAPGASLIIRAPLIVAGTENEPVVVVAADPDRHWGVFALQGANTSGSRIVHLSMSNGSGDQIDGIRYTAMFSLHDTSNIYVSGLRLQNNRDTDDMMHVVYSQDVRLLNLEFQNAYSDAIDIDISDVHIADSTFFNSGNDAIDLMSSNVLVERAIITRSGDKGISVGEASRAVVVNSRIANNAIGLEVKDNSHAQLIHTDLIKNKVQINAYQKNWRYGGGGRAEVFKSKFTGVKNLLSAKKGSSIKISDSMIVPSPEAGKRVELMPNVDFFTNTKARSETYDGRMLPLFNKSTIISPSNERGARL